MNAVLATSFEKRCWLLATSFSLKHPPTDAALKTLACAEPTAKLTGEPVYFGFREAMSLLIETQSQRVAFSHTRKSLKTSIVD
jgi:hypothetical protein